jgi:beta-xylosidase
MKEQAGKARDEARGLPLYYMEWNISSNPRDPLHDEPLAPAFVIRIIMEARGLVQGYRFWTFSDIFAENYFPSVPFHGAFGLLNLHKIAKPTYRAFQLLHGSGTERIDEEHANPRLLWQTMGEPEYLSASQVEQLEMASTLRKKSLPWTHHRGNIDLAVALPPQSVAAITIEFA